MFWAEVRRYGALDHPETWQKAYAAIRASIASTAMWDNPTILQNLFCHPDAGAMSEFNDLILEKYLEFPEALEHIKSGLEEMYYHSSSAQDQQDAIAFLKRLSHYQIDPDRLLKTSKALLPTAV